MDRILDAGFKLPADESVLVQSRSARAGTPAFDSAVADVVRRVSKLAAVQNVRSPLDSVLSITQRKGGAIGRNDDANGSPDSVLRFEAPADGEYVFEVSLTSGSSGPSI